MQKRQRWVILRGTWTWPRWASGGKTNTGGGERFSRGLRPRSGDLQAGSAQGWDDQDVVVVRRLLLAQWKTLQRLHLSSKFRNLAFLEPHPTGQQLESDPPLAQAGSFLGGPTRSSLCCHLSWHLDCSFSCIKTVSGFRGGSAVENPPANAGDTGSIPGLGRFHMPRSN